MSETEKEKEIIKFIRGINTKEAIDFLTRWLCRLTEKTNETVPLPEPEPEPEPVPEPEPETTAEDLLGEIIA